MKKVIGENCLVIENMGGIIPMVETIQDNFSLLEDVAEGRANLEKKEMANLRAKILSE